MGVLYYIGDVTNKNELINTNCEKDLGVHVDSLLNFEEHIYETVKKARRMSGLFMRTISYKTKEIMIPLYKALIRPILEYANPVWAPYKRKFIDCLESVQRNFTKQVFGLRNLSYKQRLTLLKLPSLEFRRIRGDMIEVYKISHNIYDPIKTNELLTFLPIDYPTRGHEYKISKSRPNYNPYKYFFTNRVVNLWKSLPNEAVKAKTVNTFKNHIDFHLKEFTHNININLYY